VKKLLFILLFIPLLINGQIYEFKPYYKPDYQPDFRTIREILASAVIESSDYDVYEVSTTFRLGSTGVTIAELTQHEDSDTAKFVITGSPQPTADTVLQASIDTFLIVGTNGDTITDITLQDGEIWFHWLNGDSSNYSWVVYSTPDAPSTLTISSPDSDTLTYEVSIFGSPANGTVSDSCTVRWDTAAIPTSVTDGYQVYLGDTSNVSGDFFIDMADSLEVYVSAFAKNDGSSGTGTWSVAKTDSVWIDSTGVASDPYYAEYMPIYDTLTAWDVTPSDTLAEFQSTLVERLDTAGVTLEGTNILDYLGGLLVFACEDSVAAELEWISLLSARKPEWTGTITFTQFEGFNQDDTGWGDLNWNPTDDGTHFTQNDAFVGAYTRVLPTGANHGFLLGGRGASPYLGVLLTPRVYAYGNVSTWTINSNDRGQDGAVINTTGFYLANREASDSSVSYLNGAQHTDSDTETTGLASVDWYIFTYNNNGSPNTSYVYYQGQVSIVIWGGNMTPTKQGYLNTILEDYMDSIDTGVQSIHWIAWLLIVSLLLSRKNRKGMKIHLPIILLLIPFLGFGQTYTNLYIADSLRLNDIWITS